MKMMVQLQIPLANRSVQEESWKVKLAEKLTGRKLGDFGEPEDIAETAAFLASSRYCDLETLKPWEGQQDFVFQGEIYDRLVYRCQWWTVMNICISSND